MRMHFGKKKNKTKTEDKYTIYFILNQISAGPQSNKPGIKKMGKLVNKLHLFFNQINVNKFKFLKRRQEKCATYRSPCHHLILQILLSFSLLLFLKEKESIL